jgi:hypothetical protein
VKTQASKLFSGRMGFSSTSSPSDNKAGTAESSVEIGAKSRNIAAILARANELAKLLQQRICSLPFLYFA